MEQILINTYPAGVANKLGQDVMVQRLNNLNRFDDCLVVDLDDGDKYFVHPQSLPQRSAEEILNFIQEKHLHIVFNTDVDGLHSREAPAHRVQHRRRREVQRDRGVLI